MGDVFSQLSAADRELAAYALQRGFLTHESLAGCLARAPNVPLLTALAQARLPREHLENLRQVQLAAQASFGATYGQPSAPPPPVDHDPTRGAGITLPTAFGSSPAAAPPSGGGRIPTTAGPHDVTRVETSSGSGPLTQDPSPLPSAAQRVGPYVIEHELARGGMGVVYVAQDPQLGRRVALKLLLGDNPAQLERFRIEANAAARFKHPHVVAIHQVGVDGGRPYLAMDLIEGRSLKARIDEDGPLPPDEAAELLAKVADGVYAAHTHSVLHRDLKPHNVLLDRSNQPYLTDFGLAKDITQQEQGLTVAGQAMGTPAYMSPEQADGRLDRIDRRTDVYGLGATLFETLTGCPPFEGSSTLNLITKVLTARPQDPRQLNPAIDRDLATIVLKCLEKEPDQRYDSAQELAQDLRRYLSGESILARPVGLPGRAWRRARRNPRLVGLASAVTLVLIAALAVSTALGFRAADQASTLSSLQQRLREEADARAAKSRSDEAAARLARARAESRALLEAGFANLQVGDDQSALQAFVAAAQALPADDPESASLSAQRGAAEALARLGTSGPRAPQVALPFLALDDRGEVLAGADGRGGLHLLSLSNRWPAVGPLPLGQDCGAVDVALSPPGDLAVTLVRRRVAGGPSGYAVVAHETPSGRTRWRWEAEDPQDQLTCAVFGPPADGFVAVGSRAWIHFLALDTGQRLASLDIRERTNAYVDEQGRRQPQPTADIAFSPDGRALLAAHQDGTYTIWDWQQGRCLVGNYPYPGQALTGVAYLDERIATSTAEGVVDIWTPLPSGLQRQRLLHGQSGPVKTLRWAREARVLLAACGNGDLWIWDAEGAPLQRFRHDGPLVSAALGADARVLAAADWRSTSLHTADRARRFPGHGPLALGSGRWLVYMQGDPDQAVQGAAHQPRLRTFDRQRPRPDPDAVHLLSADLTARVTLAMTSDDQDLVVAQFQEIDRGRYRFNGSLEQGDPTRLELRQLVGFRAEQDLRRPPPQSAPFAWLCALRFSPDDAWLATGSWNPVDGGAADVRSPLGVWRRQAGRLEFDAELSWHSAEVTGLSFAPDLLASCSLDGTIALWRHDGQAWSARRRLDHRRGVWLAAADQAEAPPTSREERAAHGVSSCALSPNGAWLAVGAADGRLELWQTADFDRPLPPADEPASPLRRLARSTARVVHCEFLPDGRLVAADGEGRVQIWAPLAGRVLRDLNADGVITHAAARQGSTETTIAAATADEHVWVWDAAVPSLPGFADDPQGAVERARR